MHTEHEQTVESILREAETAADPNHNGLLDRTDLQAIIAHLNSKVRQLQNACEKLTAERDALREQLDAVSFQAAVAQRPAPWDVAMNSR